MLKRVFFCLHKKKQKLNMYRQFFSKRSKTKRKANRHKFRHNSTMSESEVILKAQEDHYKGIIVSAKELTDDPQLFNIQLQGAHAHAQVHALARTTLAHCTYTRTLHAHTQKQTNTHTFMHMSHSRSQL